MSTKEKFFGKTALLIDYENFNNDDHIHTLFDELNISTEEIIIKKAFYNNLNDKNLKEKMNKYGLDLEVDTINHKDKKNTADINLTIVTMELIDRDYIDTFCIASSDSDFAPLIRKIKERNKKVIGAGTNKTNQEYQKLFDNFINVEGYSKKENKLNSKKTNLSNNEKEISWLIKEIRNIMNLLEDDEEGYIQFSQVVEFFKKSYPNLNPKDYGHTNNKWSNFFKSNNQLKIYFKLDKDNDGTTNYIKVIKK
ncbi:NYN domain-containing protein [Mycoplasmopsis lipophila]|uniref:NYN domain-containing protein n=1 Tax=Mycoplasmopsis lipophila TaxID=2117 RepID=UPI003872ACB0